MIANIGEKPLSLDCIQKALQVERPVTPITLGNNHRPASVLLPLLTIDHQWHLLFIRRTETVQDHKGQVAFPGGSVERDDRDIVTTALREAEEEIGLHPTDVQILGRMNPFGTVTNYLITPVVGLIPWPYPLQLQADEVVRAFTIPLSWLADPKRHDIRPVEVRGTRITAIHYERYDNEYLWGITAQITLDFLAILQSVCN